MRRTSTSNNSNLGIGGLALIAGLAAALVTAYAVATRRKNDPHAARDHYDGWEEGLGV